MTYTEWRDELKSNLLCVSESERRRVLDYYAEAYADRREAGFSEREIVADFGAPYDAAQRILSENKNGGYYEEPPERAEQPRRERRREEQRAYNPPPPPPPQPVYANNAPAATTTDNTWVFVLICVLLAGPIFGFIMTMVGITIGFCVAPVAVIAAGCAIAGGAIGTMVGGSVAYGLMMFGVGIIVLGVGVILCPLFFKLVSVMWDLFRKFFSWIKSFFSGKERV